MTLPKFLLADNSSHPEELFILHTEFPRCVIEVESEKVEWWDDVEAEESTEEDLVKVVEEAFAFLEKELDTYNQEE